MLLPAELTVKILSPSNGGEYVTMKMRGGQILDEAARREYYITFSPPPSTWWNDVRFTCSTIQLCTSKQDAEGLFERLGFRRGDTMDLDTLWELSKVMKPLVLCEAVSVSTDCVSRHGMGISIRTAMIERLEIK